ncbi:hypothetical protein Tco_0844795 [Tanacetum coccineum]
MFAPLTTPHKICNTGALGLSNPESRFGEIEALFIQRRGGANVKRERVLRRREVLICGVAQNYRQGCKMDGIVEEAVKALKKLVFLKMSIVILRIGLA